MVGVMNLLFVLDEQRRSAAYLDDLYPYGHLRQAKVNALLEYQSSGEEALRPFFGRTLMPSMLDKAFKG